MVGVHVGVMNFKELGDGMYEIVLQVLLYHCVGG